ncbi:hypothetical protein [Aeromicrobium sp. HA]|uniref:hypothetical protein n=1 Tax=Aeromicrobium sp. HA TaxID=3009077 RepID=UPI0022AFF8ED|nr:hypothetical protein [Aeromicrobium sp. HA]
MYGENTRIIREQLAILLRQHRIQHRIGGPGIPTLPTTSTPVERRLIGLQLGRYRHAVLVWALEAVRAVDPRPHIPLADRRDRSPTTELQARLTEAVRESGPRPSIEELGGAQRYPMLIAWQTAARAATLGEHDFGATISFSSLTTSQVRTVLKDAATVTRALVVLDRRYASTPAWRPLTNRGRLADAADRCITLTDAAGVDPTVDSRGWRPQPHLITGPLSPGLAGVLQAHHNLFVSLHSIPNAQDLRRIVASQLTVSRTIAGDSDGNDPLRDTCRQREETYRQLQQRLRDVYGQTGRGAEAVSRAHIAAEYTNALTREDRLDSTPASEDLARLFTRLDDRIGRIIELGAQERLFFERVPLPEIDLSKGGPIKGQAVTYEPIRSSTPAGLVAFARSELRAIRGNSGTDDGHEHTRRQLDAALEVARAAPDGTVRAL